MCVHTPVCERVSECVCVRACTHVCEGERKCVCVSVYTPVCVSARVRVHTCEGE